MPFDIDINIITDVLFKIVVIPCVIVVLVYVLKLILNQLKEVRRRKDRAWETALSLTLKAMERSDTFHMDSGGAKDITSFFFQTFSHLSTSSEKTK